MKGGSGLRKELQEAEADWVRAKAQQCLTEAVKIVLIVSSVSSYAPSLDCRYTSRYVQ